MPTIIMNGAITTAAITTSTRNPEFFIWAGPSDDGPAFFHGAAARSVRGILFIPALHFQENVIQDPTFAVSGEIVRAANAGL